MLNVRKPLIFSRAGSRLEPTTCRLQITHHRFGESEAHRKRGRYCQDDYSDDIGTADHDFGYQITDTGYSVLAKVALKSGTTRRKSSRKTKGKTSEPLGRQRERR